MATKQRRVEGPTKIVTEREVVKIRPEVAYAQLETDIRSLRHIVLGAGTATSGLAIIALSGLVALALMLGRHDEAIHTIQGALQETKNISERLSGVEHSRPTFSEVNNQIGTLALKMDKVAENVAIMKGAVEKIEGKLEPISGSRR